MSTVTEMRPEISSFTPINSSSSNIASSNSLSILFTEIFPLGSSFLKKLKGVKKDGLSITLSCVWAIFYNF